VAAAHVGAAGGEQLLRGEAQVAREAGLGGAQEGDEALAHLRVTLKEEREALRRGVLIAAREAPPDEVAEDRVMYTHAAPIAPA